MLRALICIIVCLGVAEHAGLQASQDRSGLLDGLLREPHLTTIGVSRRLNAFCVGTGSPTVIFEQGGEGNIANWKDVQPAISSMTRTCFYDRAGFGYSDPPRLDVTAINVTDDLRALLTAKRVEGPVVLVGHSIGGFYATVYADRFPEDVAGLVLVDPGFSGQEAWRTIDDQKAEFPNIRRGEQGLLECARLARSGKLDRRTLKFYNCFPLPDELPSGEARYLLHSLTGPHWYEAEYSQSVNFFFRDLDLSVSQAQEAEVRRSFGAMPVEVLTAAHPPSSSWQTIERAQAAHGHWQAGHRQLAARSTRGRWMVVDESGHFIQKDKPQAVISAVTRVVQQARAAS